MAEKKKYDPESVKIVYSEILESLNFQRDVINIIHTKSNWLAALNVAAIVGLSNIDFLDFYKIKYALLIVFIVSLFFSVINFLPTYFSRGPSNEDLLKSFNYELGRVVAGISVHRKLMIDNNKNNLDKLSMNLKIATIFFIIGLSITCFIFATKI